MKLLLIVIFLGVTGAIPVNLLRSVAENGYFEDFENYLPKNGDLPKFRYSTFTDDKDNDVQVDFKKFDNNQLKSFGDVFNSVRNGAAGGTDPLEVKKSIPTTLSPPDSTQETSSEATTTAKADETTEMTTELTTPEVTTETGEISAKLQLDPLLNSSNETEINRPIRQEESEEDEDDDEETASVASEEAASNEEDTSSSEEEEDGNMITGLISAFLGGLSRPDGSIDVEAITGLLGSLSSQNEDGSYNFGGLTDLLMSFFGGGGEDGGGSDFGAFLGGIAGAFIKGVANPPGAKGAGIFTGNLLTGVLPALSGPPPPAEGEKPQEGLDSGGFLGGLLQSIFGSSGGLSGGSGSGSSGAGDMAGGGGGSKFQIFKAVFSLITSIFSKSSASGAPPPAPH